MRRCFLHGRDRLCYSCRGLGRNGRCGLNRGTGKGLHRCRKGAGRLRLCRAGGGCLHRYCLQLLGRLGQAEQCQLQLNALVAAAGHVLQRRAKGADGADGLPLAKLRAFLQVQCFFLRRNAGQQRLPAGQRRQHQGPVVGDQLLGQALHVHRLLPQLRQLCQRGGGVLCLQSVRDVEQVAAVGHASHAAHHVRVNFCRNAGAGVQNRQGIAQCTIGQTGDQFCAVGGQLQLFLPGDILHPPCDILRPDAGKIVPLAAGKNGGGHLLDLGGGQNEDDVCGRLLQRFQQRIEGRCRQHVHLVDDIHLILAGAGGVGGLVPQVADVIHAVVGGCVHLHHIQQAAVVNAFADLARPAGIAIDRMQAVDRLGKDLGAGGLAGAAHTGKQIRMAHTACGDLVFQGGHDGTLTHHILKPLGSPLAVKRTIHGNSSPFPPFAAKIKGQRTTGFCPRLA